MLPIMSFSLLFVFVSFFNYIKSLQKIVEEIYLDKSGNEVLIIYRNRRYRKFRGSKSEEVFINSALMDPDPDVYNYPKSKFILSFIR
jgi:hypothetical protein